MAKRSKQEALRRLLIGDIRRLLHQRYGATLPDDDAGRDDLCLLLGPISLDPKSPVDKMLAQVEVIAPWMPTIEAKEIIGSLANLPLFWRKQPAKEIGERLRLTNAERERLRLWRIAPVDLTGEELIEQRKAKDRARKRKRYVCSRADYLAKSKSKLKPWEAEGIGRRTWYRRRGTSPSSANILIGEDQPVPVGQHGCVSVGRRDDTETDGQATEPNECQLSSIADGLVPTAETLPLTIGETLQASNPKHHKPSSIPPQPVSTGDGLITWRVLAIWRVRMPNETQMRQTERQNP